MMYNESNLWRRTYFGWVLEEELTQYVTLKHKGSVLACNIREVRKDTKYLEWRAGALQERQASCCDQGLEK